MPKRAGNAKVTIQGIPADKVEMSAVRIGRRSQKNHSFASVRLPCPIPKGW